MSTGSTSISGRQRASLLRRHALHCKYEKAVKLYADTDMSVKDIAIECGHTAGALGNYLRRYWRELVLHRHGITVEDKDLLSFKIIEAGGMSASARIKYGSAVEACRSLDYIELNMSQVARKFSLDATALANFMRVHFPDVLLWREQLRRSFGFCNGVHRGVRPESLDQYAEAVRLYRTTDMTQAEIARKCRVSLGGLNQHLRFYCNDVLCRKRQSRKVAKENDNKRFGENAGNGRKHAPAPSTVHKYAGALALYLDTDMTINEVVARTGVSAGGFRFYLRRWHGGGRSSVVPSGSLRAAAKYAAAIDSLRCRPRPVAQVAADFGLNPDVFRCYLRAHEPELASRHGRMRTANGRLVSSASREKYAEALRLYSTTAESLRSIASRLGLVYNSVGGYIRRNHPEAVALHASRVAAIANA